MLDVIIQIKKNYSNAVISMQTSGPPAKWSQQKPNTVMYKNMYTCIHLAQYQNTLLYRHIDIEKYNSLGFTPPNCIRLYVCMCSWLLYEINPSQLCTAKLCHRQANCSAIIDLFRMEIL